ncbi:MAG: hypothetical protein OXE92_10095 [Bacteroidetes bacterium]|nr:hypothetical protein [Bacteroidota bacterium]MCY4206059.1 hypothetical protein [Bacteroidota bacterium]
MLLNIFLYIVISLIGLALLVMVASGVRSLLFGKIKTISIAFMAVPPVLFLILGLALPTWTDAGIMTIVISLVLTLLALLVSGIKNLVS